MGITVLVLLMAAFCFDSAAVTVMRITKGYPVPSLTIGSPFIV
jgi:hypothetical protein